MTLHKYDLNPLPFQQISEKRKCYELRLYDKKRQSIRPGDVIEFTNNQSGERLLVEVESLHIYTNFQALYEDIDPLLLGYDQREDANYKDMNRYYDEDRQKNDLVVAIKIKLKHG